MKNNWIIILCQIYALLILLGISVISTPPRFIPTLLLLLMVLATIIRPIQPRLNIILYTAIIFITPVILASPLESRATLPPAVVQLSSVAVILPIFYLLDNYLKQNTIQTRLDMKKKPGINISNAFISLAVLTLIVVFISLVISNRTLLYTGGIFFLYLSGIMMNTILNIHRNPLAARTASIRIIAGNYGDTSIDLTNHASTPIHCQFGSSEEWLEILPLAAVLNKGRVRLNLSYTPPLAGNSRPQIHSIAKDLRGFIYLFQILEPLEMEIIPKAKYAEWLARRYLQQAGATGTGIGTVPKETQKALVGGIEYRESRDYQPGDQMKDIDWKHTLRLNQLIIKEYSPDEDTSAIIAVNLSVGDDEEADSLAYNLITTALTLARDSIPSALTAYNNEGVVLATGVNEPEITLGHTLSLIKDINRVESIPRYLDLADVSIVKRNISQLKRVDTEAARQLLGILGFEYQAIDESTRKHPATIALTSTAKQVVGPATILLVSQLNHDAEAIKVITAKLSKRLFNTIRVASPAEVILR